MDGATQSSPDVTEVDCTPLGIDDLFDVKRELNPVSAKWKSIGVALRLNPNTLDGIEAKNSGDPSTCLISMVTEWLRKNYNVKRFGEPTWQRLVETVGDPAGGENMAIARDMASRHKVGGTMDSPNLNETRVDETIIEKMKDLQIHRREKIYPYSVEDIKFLEILKKLGELKQVSHLVASCEVLVTEHCVKLVGTPEETRQAKGEIDHILEHAVRETESLPEFVSSQIVGEHVAKCMEMNEGVLVLPEERKMKFIAKSAESCEKAKEWLQAHAYPAALEFTAGKEIFGRYVYTTSSRPPSRTPVTVKAVPEAFCAEYLHPPDHDPRTPLYFTMELPKKTAAAALMPFTHNLSWCSGSIRQKLQRVFEKVQPYRANFKVGYEARFGHVFWKLDVPGGPGYEAAGKQWTLDQFKHPHLLHSQFFVRVRPDIHELLSTYTDDLHLLVKLLDPLKLEVTRRDGTKVDCVAVIEELRDGRFILNNV